MSRTRNSAWNMASGLTYALVSTLAGLLATPWLLHWLGRERLGALKALTDWVGYLTFFELGLGGAMMAALAMRIGRNDRAGITGMLAASLQLSGRVMLVSLACGIVLVLALPQVLPASNLTASELRSAGTVILLSLLFTPLLVFRALAEARQRSYLYWSLLTFQVLLTTGLSLLMARAGWGLVGQGVAWLIAQIPTLLVLVWDGVRKYREMWGILPDKVDQKALWSLSWPTFIHQLADRIGLVSDNIMIAWMLGPAALVPFYLTQQLAVIAQSQLRGLSSATWAGLVEIYAHGDFAKFRMRLLDLTKIVSGLSLVVLGPIAIYNHSFVQHWVGKDLYAGDVVTGLTCLNNFLWSIFILWGWMLLGTGHIRQWIPYSIASTIVNISASVIGTVTLGVVGPLIGSTVGLLFVTSWALPRILERVFGISPWTMWKAALAPLRWGPLYILVMWLISNNRPPQGWFELFAWMGFWVACGITLWWKLGLGWEERTELRARLRKVTLLR